MKYVMSMGGTPWETGRSRIYGAFFAKRIQFAILKCDSRFDLLTAWSMTELVCIVIPFLRSGPVYTVAEYLVFSCRVWS